MRMLTIITGFAILAASLSACSQFEPFQRVGTWHETDAASQNVAAELQTPTDLLYGRSSPVMTGTISDGAISQVEKTVTSGDSGVSASASAK